MKQYKYQNGSTWVFFGADSVADALKKSDGATLYEMINGKWTLIYNGKTSVADFLMKAMVTDAETAIRNQRGWVY